MKEDLEQRAAAAANRAPLSVEDILGDSGPIKLTAYAVSTPEWKEGSHVFVAELSADERDDMEEQWAGYKRSLDDDQSNVGFRAFVTAYCLCDVDRNLMFAGRVAEVAQKIGNRNAKTTARIFNACSKLNGLTKADIDELEKK